MKSEYFIFLVLFVGLFVGCNEAKYNSSQSKLREESVSSAQKENITSNNNLTKENIILNQAQKNYQDSYNEYVRCLRESGPQTIVTLQALSVYQKNYHIYQMLLKAEAEKQ